MRRNVGLSSLSQQSSSLSAYSSLSTSLSAQQLSTLQSQLTLFQSSLRTFANKHRSKILSDPVFRTHFADMCNQLGVDPLGSGGRKGVWDYLGVGEWTYALAVQVVDVCLNSRERNGGLMEIDEVVRGVTRLRSGPSRPSSMKLNSTDEATSVTDTDVIRAIAALEPLGCGYSIITVGDKKMVRSVAAEFDTDSLTLLEAASSSGLGLVTVSSVREWTVNKQAGGAGGRMGWTVQRTVNALDKATMQEGLLWVDDQEQGEIQYWLPSLFDFQEELAAAAAT